MSSTTKHYGIIVGVDGSPASDAAVNWAAHDAVMRGVALTLMHVQDPIARTWSQAKALEEVAGWQKAEVVAFSRTRRRLPMTLRKMLRR